MSKNSLLEDLMTERSHTSIHHAAEVISNKPVLMLCDRLLFTDLLV